MAAPPTASPSGESPSGPFTRRTFGVLLHPSSLPGADQIGTLGDAAHRFVEWLATTGAGIWQILPLTINGKDHSPYFSTSAFAGNPWLVDLDGLRAAGLLEAADVPSPRASGHLGERVPFDELRRRKLPPLRRAADTLLGDRSHPWAAPYHEFTSSTTWLGDACLFLALGDRYRTPWWEWPDALRRRDEAAVLAARDELADEIARWSAMLFFFEVQWSAVRASAHSLGIRILGDLPIYVAPDSADVWANQEQFELHPDGSLVSQSGVPPDYFSATGQLWGNPLYRWDVMASDGYRWWIDRLRRCLELTDLVRIDHFRALSAYWEVAAGAPDAIGGRWVAGPGQHFLDAVRAAVPEFPFVAEDLGTLDDDVYALRDRNGLPGMRIIQFGFDGTPDNPHRTGSYPEQCIAYTGTHDNEPIAAWWESLSPAQRDEVGRYYQHGRDADAGRATWSFIEAAFASDAIAAVVPMQDLLVLDGRARMNDPSVPTGNWGWRMPADGQSADLAASLRRVAERHRRVAPSAPP